MDEYVGGISANYVTNSMVLERSLELLTMLKEDMNSMGAEDLHQLQRTWELNHRILASESVTHHTLFRKEARWPGYYYRGDHMKLDDENWHCFKWIGKCICPARTVPHDVPNLPLRGPGLTAHNGAYVASRAAIGKKSTWQSIRMVRAGQ